ncbi:uncharacterized protein LOC143043591 [Mytilus galloprovincialis]|uniref:uncharacterized protein LOC143043591 n=1 Tax=Mytilus galloprovincialis TaxID=29158 RepID=UPI003F7BDBF4
MSSACLNRIFLLFIYCVPTVKLADTSFKINWTIRDLPSTCIFGSNVTLFCNTSSVGSMKAIWMKQSDVILHQGFSFYPDKYTGNEVNDGSSLIIMNATESDFNTSYTCLSDVYSHEKVLVINSSSFICLPKKTNSSLIINGRNISVHLNLDRFFPVPNCKTKFDDDVLITHQQESVYKENQYFHGTINITSHSNVDICGGNLTVVCMFGASHYNVILLRDCEVSDNSECGFKYLHVNVFFGTIIGVLVSLIVLCIGCMLFVRTQCKMIERNKKPEDTLEEGMPLDDGQTNEKIDKKEAEQNKAHSNKQRTNTLRHHFMTKCFHVNRNKKDVGI